MAVNNRTKALKAQDAEVIDFAPAHVKQATIKAIHESFTKYWLARAHQS